MEFTQVFAAALLVVLITETTYGLPQYFKDCGSKKSVIQSVSVSGCQDTDETCNLKKGSTVLVTIGFKTTEVITNATAVVHGIVAGIPVPFPIPESNGCKTGLSCPVKKDASAVYKSEIGVLKSFPDLKVAVKWELKDQTTAEVFCAIFRAEIVS